MDHANQSPLPAEVHFEPLDGKFSWRYILNIALNHRRHLLVANLIALVATLFTVTAPLLMPLLVDEVLLNHPGKELAVINALLPKAYYPPEFYIVFVVVVVILMRFIAMLFGVWQTRQFTHIAKDVTFQIRQALLLRLGSIAIAEYETIGSGAVASRFVSDIQAIDDFVGQTIARALIAILTLIGITTILLWMSWQLTLFILLLNPLIIYFIMKLGKRIKALKKRENSALELFQEALTETLDSIQQIRACNREHYFLQWVINRARGVRDHAIQHAWISDAASRFSFVVYIAGIELFRAGSMIMVITSDLTIGQMTAVFGYLWLMMSHIQELFSIPYTWYSASAALKRINELMALQQEPDYPQRYNPFNNGDTVSVTIDNLCFSYQPDRPILDHLSLQIGPGEKVALVGASGGGKSTLVQLIIGLYPAQSGTIQFDNIPLTEIGLSVVREHVAVVLQHPAMFNSTVRMNLTLGRMVDDQQLWDALTVAHLNSDIANLPDGLESQIGSRGVRLSGGQLQRLAIARLILTDPQVVILDEATSALDTVTEARLHHALHTFLKGRTTLIVAHRLSAVKQAERIYVFDAGKIIEQGTHQQLVNRHGLYNRLYGELQAH